MTRGVLFIAHGTRRRHGIEECNEFLHAVAERLTPRSAPLATCAFLELEPPGIEDAAEQLIRAGATSITIVPLLLFAAGHMKSDIPTEIATVQSRHPNVAFDFVEPFGEDDAFVNAAVDRARQAIRRTSLPDNARAVLFLGRGNRDDTAQTAFERVADRFAKQLSAAEVASGEVPLAPLPPRKVQIGYLAGSGLSLEAALDSLAEEDFREIVIQPYLWFSGWLTDTLPDRVESWQRSSRQAALVNVTIARHLGVDMSMVHAVARRIAKIGLSRLS
ncbi:sirohydrochlorin chelatase [Alicyclobacillus acidiphilus]|uniref:sirohydrochlorin chelatase n=1 Tax=Alicyclobacillus acidiphilus TaxID=182455 RepID=UPI00082EC656|nr:CbiX/SirB N-terminal domain-containing protein [Alicyclobacillus acidiphilus]